MKGFSMRSQIFEMQKFSDFTNEFNISESDLIFTHRFIYETHFKNANLKCKFLIQEDFGVGEPSDIMVNKILIATQKLYIKRIIGIGGGTVLDISKLLVLRDVCDVDDIFYETSPLFKDKDLILIPTTCGTGAEMTCVSVVDMTKRKVKIGKRIDGNFASSVILIEELIKGLPYPIFAYSSIDALIHALEIFVAPTATTLDRVFSKMAIEIILKEYMSIIKNGKEYLDSCIYNVLRASNYAGIALANTVCGAVHACAMHFGGKHHIPHGEANYVFLMGVFKKYLEKQPNGIICDVATIIKSCLNLQCDDKTAFMELEKLLNQIIPQKHLKEYGVVESELMDYVDMVFESQQRLLVNNYTPLAKEELLDVYKNLY